jgi:hypothetical protein
MAFIGCAPKAEIPPRVEAVPPVVSASPAAPPATATAAEAKVEAPPPRRSRRGECALDDAMREFIGGEPEVRCTSITSRSPKEAYDAMTECILGAVKQKKSFSASITVSGIDSVFGEAYAGRGQGADYEVRVYSYDSCPSGCGDEDPMWGSDSCHPLVSLDKACAKMPQKGADEGLQWACDMRSRRGQAAFGDPRNRIRALLGVFCTAPKDAGRCPSDS